MEEDEPVLVAERQPPKQRQRQQQQQVVVKQEPDFEGGDQQLALVPSRGLAAVPGSSSGSKQVLEVCVEPPGGGEWAVTQLQLSQVRGGHTSGSSCVRNPNTIMALLLTSMMLNPVRTRAAA
jgi:hypothetical protein